MSRTFAYARVSTFEQTAENQLGEIRAAGFALEKRRIVSETISGSTTALERPGFARLVDRLEEGDVLVVTKLDRLGRNAMDVRRTVDQLADLGVKVHCMALGGVDLTSAAGRMTMGVINAVAEFERDLLIERTQAGLKRAREEGKAIGRPPLLSIQRKRDVLRKLDEGMSISKLSREYRVSRITIARIRDARAGIDGGTIIEGQGLEGTGKPGEDGDADPS